MMFLKLIGIKSLYGVIFVIVCVISQWEYQVGFCEGIVMGDQLWIFRFLFYRVLEDFGYKVFFDFKFMLGDWNGVGVYINYR